jgi:transcriptional regulator with XRE-family HTH domain
MSQKARHHLAPSASPALEPKELGKLEFGRRLMQLTLEKGWNQSDLARAAGLGRDAISTYVRGRSFPEPRSLKRIADALGLSTEQLLPNIVAMAMDADTSPMLEIKQAAGHPDKVFLRINQMVSLQQAAAIFNIIKEG